MLLGVLNDNIVVVEILLIFKVKKKLVVLYNNKNKLY